MLNLKKRVLSLLALTTLTAFSAQASVIDTVLVGEYADEIWGGGFYTIDNQSSQAITEFGVTTGQLDELGTSPWVDEFYPYSSENVAVAYTADDWDYYLGDVWSASFYDETSWNATFLDSHGSYDSLYGEESGISGVNWFYFDQGLYDDLVADYWLESNASDFYIDAGDKIGDEFGSFFRFESEIASNFAAFNSGNGVTTLIDTGSANESIDVPEPATIGLFALAMLLTFGQRRENK
ncbi:MAG: PEP-CTERM sorting domain-containing protein [Thalassotalea sp.]